MTNYPTVESAPYNENIFFSSTHRHSTLVHESENAITSRCNFIDDRIYTSMHFASLFARIYCMHSIYGLLWYLVSCGEKINRNRANSTNYADAIFIPSIFFIIAHTAIEIAAEKVHCRCKRRRKKKNSSLCSLQTKWKTVAVEWLERDENDLRCFELWSLIGL